MKSVACRYVSNRSTAILTTRGSTSSRAANDRLSAISSGVADLDWPAFAGRDGRGTGGAWSWDSRRFSAAMVFGDRFWKMGMTGIWETGCRVEGSVRWIFLLRIGPAVLVRVVGHRARRLLHNHIARLFQVLHDPPGGDSGP